MILIQPRSCDLSRSLGMLGLAIKREWRTELLDYVNYDIAVHGWARPIRTSVKVKLSANTLKKEPVVVKSEWLTR